jgi:hypothetical protein
VLNPKKGFAGSVARAMPTGTGSTANTAKISKLYTAFDPIDYIKSVPSWKTIYLETVNVLINIYNAKLQQDDLKPNFNVRAKAIAEHANLNPVEQPAIAALLTKKFTDIWEARSLIQIVPLNEDQFLNLFSAAINTNKAVYHYLASRIDQTPFVFPDLL